MGRARKYIYLKINLEWWLPRAVSLWEDEKILETSGGAGHAHRECASCPGLSLESGERGKSCITKKSSKWK